MMNKTEKRSRKEAQKKLFVRILCIALVAALLLTTFLSMFTWIQ